MRRIATHNHRQLLARPFDIAAFQCAPYQRSFPIQIAQGEKRPDPENIQPGQCDRYHSTSDAHSGNRETDAGPAQWKLGRSPESFELDRTPSKATNRMREPARVADKQVETDARQKFVRCDAHQ